MVTLASGDKYPRACTCHRGSPRRNECAPALRRLQVLVLAPPQSSEPQDRRIHELGSLSFFSLPDCGEADSITIFRVVREANRLKTAGCYFTPASPRAWAACRAAGRPRGGVTPPTPRWSARGNSGRRSCRWQRRRIQESLRPPSRRWSRMSDRNEKVSALPLSAVRIHAVDLPAKVTCSRRKRAWLLIAAPVRRWHSRQWHMEMRDGSPSIVR